MEPQKKIRIGDLLVQNQIITQEQLMSALAEQKKTGRKLGRTLIDLNYIDETELLNFLSRQLQIPFLDITKRQRSEDAARLLPERHARRFRVLLLENNPDSVLLAMADPTDLLGLDELTRILKKRIQPAVVRESDLLVAIDQTYRRTEEINDLAEQLQEELNEEDFDFSSLASGDDLSAAPVAKLLQTIFEDAVQIKASDIHIEPDEKVLRIRRRIDGVLQEQVIDEVKIASALVVRIKLMAGLNISEKRLPQDGRFSIRVKNKPLDIRISTLPVQFGESIVMRILDHSSGLLDLTTLGMPEDLLVCFRKHIHNPHGLVLVTGPTGSGKTTTLYAALHEVNKPENKIITAEDPVEYSLPRINQVQINDRVGLTFAGVLRSALRQDPDIILVGEMRDSETVQIALRAAITGHLVFSTLHTNSAIATATRLLDMGVEGHLLASALRIIIAQRLVRIICSNCTVEHKPDANQQNWLKTLQPASAELAYYQGQGCPQCNYSGYSCRIGIYELLEMHDDTLDALRRGDNSAFTQAALATPGFTPFAQCAIAYAKKGITTLAEVIRVAGDGR